MIDKEGYRENVAIVIINNDHKVLWAKRINENAWQFPQGGIKKSETIEGAMFRELKEEVGIDEDKIEILGRTSDWLYYDVPKNWIRKDNNITSHLFFRGFLSYPRQCPPLPLILETLLLQLSHFS